MKMVRTSLLAVTAGALISPALMAADIVADTVTLDLSDEYLSTANATDVVTGDTLAVVLGSEYTVDDVITLAFSGSALDPASLANSITVAAAPPFKGLTLGLLSSSASEAVYRVTALVGPSTDTTVGLSVTISGGLDFNAQAVDAAGGVNVAFSAQTNNGLPLDTGGGDDRNVDYLDVVNQFSAEATETFNGIVDVNADRLLFTDVAPDGTDLDNVAIAITDDAPDLAAAFDSAEYSIMGDFGWVFDDDDVTPGIQPAAGVFTPSAGCGADFEVTPTQITWSCTVLTAALEIDVTANVDGNGDQAVLPKTSFLGTVTVLFDGFGNSASPEGSKTLLSGASVGAWVLNGFQALIPYMPYGTGISQVIYLVNRGSQAGDVTVDYTDQNGNQASLGVVANLGATTTLSIGPLIKAALPAALQNSGRIGLTVTANVPAGDVQINSQYNVSGNRAFTLHEDNRP